MNDDPLRLDDTAFNRRIARWREYKGIHSGKMLTALDLTITAVGPEEIQRIESLLAKEVVTVSDPVQQRTYSASISLQTTSYQDGRSQRDYTIEVRESDEIPSFETIEIEGEEFAVLEYRETEEQDEAVGRHVLLKLTDHGLAHLRNRVKPGPVQVKRKGVDESPMLLRYGGAMYWSRHEEAGEEFYKQIVRLYPINSEPLLGHGLASGVTQDNLVDTVLELSTKLQALIDELHQSGALDERAVARFRSGAWKESVNAQSAAELRWRFEQVKDASDEL